MTTIDNTEIKYDRTTKDYAIYVDGQIIGYGRNYSEAEQKRTEYLRERDFDSNACGGWGCVDTCGDCVAPDMDFSQDAPTVGAQLRSQGLRKARAYEAGWYVNVIDMGRATKVWACEASEPVTREPLRFWSYADTKGG